jgi:hypothetical protein
VRFSPGGISSQEPPKKKIVMLFSLVLFLSQRRDCCGQIIHEVVSRDVTILGNIWAAFSEAIVSVDHDPHHNWELADPSGVSLRYLDLSSSTR